MRTSLSWMILAVFFIILTTQSAVAQSGLRESLERMDTDKDGNIEPEEITSLSRPYMERIAAAGRMSIDSRSNSVREYLAAARRYYSNQNGGDDQRVRPETNETVKPFGPEHDEPVVPEFGLGQVKYPYTQADLDFVDRTMRTHDRNGDGYIDRAEARVSEWTHRNPYEDDLNGDDKISRLELVQRYARRRLIDEEGGELRKKAWRTGGIVSQSSPSTNQPEWWRQSGSDYYLTASVLTRFDRNKNGQLEGDETKSLGLPVAQIDLDLNGSLSREELFSYLKEIQDTQGGTAASVPDWFYELDKNGDKQVSMLEFCEEWTAAKVNEFEGYDLNTDGFLTADEISRAGSTGRGRMFDNRRGIVLTPGKSIISEIEVDDDFVIGDVNLKLGITHSNVEDLDAYLAGPNGERIELFTAIGGSGNHFHKTTFDDQSKYPIDKARAPYTGTFIPEGLSKKQPSLGHFNGMSSRGLWQLIVHATRSSRYGMLHGWSLVITPESEMSGDVNPTVDGPQQLASPPPTAPQPITISRSGLLLSPSDNNAGRVYVRPQIDYRAIGQRMEEAVKSGKMTREQVNSAWIKIKQNAKQGQNQEPNRWKGFSDKSNGETQKPMSSEEAKERYRKMMEMRKSQGRR